FALLTLTVSAVLYFHGFVNGGELLTLGFILVSGAMLLWFRDVITEGTKKALFSLHITPLFTKVIATIASLYGGAAVAFVIYVVYTQSIVPDISSDGLILFYSLAPIKAADDKPRRLTTEERAQFTLSSELKDISIGLLLGDLYILK